MPNPFGDFFSVVILDYAGIIIGIFAVTIALYKILKWRKVNPPGFFHDIETTLGKRTMISTFFSEFVERVILFKGVINDSGLRRAAHYFVFWGFVGTAVATTLDDIYNHSATKAFLPALVFGNVGGILLLIGGTIMLARRSTVDRRISTARVMYISKILTPQERVLADSMFLLLLYLTTITGFMAEAGNFSGNPQVALVNYVIHLAFVTMLFISAPFTHFFHAILEPAMRYVGRLQNMISLKIGSNYKHKAMSSEMFDNLTTRWEKELRDKENT